MIEYIPLALSSLKNAKDIASSLIELRDFDKIASATLDLKGHLIQTYDHIISEKERVLSLQERISELEKECARLKNWNAEKEKYSRKLISEGIFAYVLNDTKECIENSHKLCCTCFEKGMPSTLQQNFYHGRGHQYELRCPNGCLTLAFYQYVDDKS